MFSASSIEISSFVGISTPPKLRNVENKLGWCNIAVDNLAERLVFKGFKK